MRTLVIGDIHLDDKVKGHLDAQLGCIDTIINDSNPEEIIFLGDVFMHRSPSPKVLVYFKKCIDRWKQSSTVHILRGNHDSANKSDDGLTALSVYNDKNVFVWNSPGWRGDKYFIPHYEDEAYIKKCLHSRDKNTKVFGHFGYRGCLNSAGDADSTLDISDFKCKTYLGHIHSFKRNGMATILGTPYTTNFGEAGSKGYYLILEEGNEEYVEIDYGPRHIVATLDEVKEDIDSFCDAEWFTLLRIVLNPGESVSDIPEELFVDYLDVKVKPVFDDKDETITNYSPKRDLFTINDQIIEDYVDSCQISPSMNKDLLMRGYTFLKQGYNEDKTTTN